MRKRIFFIKLTSLYSVKNIIDPDFELTKSAYKAEPYLQQKANRNVHEKRWIFCFLSSVEFFMQMDSGLTLYRTLF